MFTLNSVLKDVTFVTLRFNCLVNEDVDLTWSIMYRLRKDISSVAESLMGDKGSLAKVFPLESVVQDERSTYPFVFDFNRNFFGLKSSGDELSFDVRFFGHGSAEIEQMIDLVRSMISMHWSMSLSIDLQFVAVVGLDGTESYALEKGSLDSQPLVFQEVEWCGNWVKSDNNRARLRFTTPTRLQYGANAPYFDPEWRQIVPFVIKRVVSALSIFNVVISNSEIEAVTDSLLSLDSFQKSFKWMDVVQKNRHPYGGFVGEIELKGYCPEDVFSWLVAGSLLHVGKGASFGAGSYKLL